MTSAIYIDLSLDLNASAAFKLVHAMALLSFAMIFVSMRRLFGSFAAGV